MQLPTPLPSSVHSHQLWPSRVGARAHATPACHASRRCRRQLQLRAAATLVPCGCSATRLLWCRLRLGRAGCPAHQRRRWPGLILRAARPARWSYQPWRRLLLICKLWLWPRLSLGRALPARLPRLALPDLGRRCRRLRRPGGRCYLHGSSPLGLLPGLQGGCRRDVEGLLGSL